MKLIITVSIALLLWQSQSVCAGCVQGDCINGKGTAVLADGSKYVGEFREAFRTGRGIMTYPDGTQYDGDWQNDKPHGKGTLSSVGKYEYRGEFVDGVRHGQGTLETIDGKRYVGQWQNDVPHGEGRIISPGREDFVGQFVNGRRQGQGEVITYDATRYKGQWANDLPNGQGIKTLPDGMQYAGEFKNGLMYGRGSVIMPDGSRVAILWQSDVPGQKDENQPEATSLTFVENRDWYMVPTPGQKQDEEGQYAIASDKPEVVALQEPAIAAATVPPREEAAPIARVEEIPPPMSLKKRVAAQEQTQPPVPSEIPVQEAATAPSEALAPDAGVRTPGSAEEHGETATATEAVEYVSIAQFAAGANIRAAASLSSDVLRSVPPGYPLAVLERQGDWVLVQDFRERKGWVSAPLLREPGTVIIKVWKGNLRRGPGLTDAIIGKLDHGTVLSVLETRGDWLQVSDSKETTGWLHRNVIWPSENTIFH